MWWETAPWSLREEIPFHVPVPPLRCAKHILLLPLKMFHLHFQK